MGRLKINKLNEQELNGLKKAYKTDEQGRFGAAQELVDLWNILDKNRHKMNEANRPAMKHILDELEAIIDADLENINAAFNKARGVKAS